MRVVSNAPRLASFTFIQVYKAFYITILTIRGLSTQAYNLVLKCCNCKSVYAYTDMTTSAHVVDPIRRGSRRVVAIAGELSDDPCSCVQAIHKQQKTMMACARQEFRENHIFQRMVPLYSHIGAHQIAGRNYHHPMTHP